MLAALGQPVRWKIFQHLVTAGPEGMTPGALVHVSGESNSNLSFHLKELVRAELVTQERQGRYLVYRACPDRMNALVGFLTQSSPESDLVMARAI